MTICENNKGLFDTVLNTVTDTIELVADNINTTRSKRYFRIKKGHLYWYSKEDSDKAQNDLDIKKIKQVEINQENDKMILIVYQNKLYKLEFKNKDYILEWYKSICLVMSKSEEYLNLNRYVDTKVFERVSGKSLFRDFEEILKENADRIEQQKRKEEEEAKRIRDAEIEVEVRKEIEAKKALEERRKGKLRVKPKVIVEDEEIEEEEDADKKKNSNKEGEKEEEKSEAKFTEKEVRVFEDNKGSMNVPVNPVVLKKMVRVKC